ncbi:hypothetical protein HMPREF1142_1242 [Peptostreptococcaceae bacterium AS15]|nr:hypothetical protein HMPREF1142_1242 [Peptostreptococcaceae bacterium AS15]
MPNVNIGDVLEINDKEIKEKYTTAPKHYTEVILITIYNVTYLNLLKYYLF